MSMFQTVAMWFRDVILQVFGIQATIWQAFGAGLVATFLSIFVVWTITRFILIRMLGGYVSSFFSAQSDGVGKRGGN